MANFLSVSANFSRDGFMVRFLSVAAIAGAIILAASGAWAQAIPAPAIAVLDVEGVERGSNAWKSVTEELDARRTAYEQQIRELQTPLEEKFKALEGQRAILSSEAFAQQQQALNQEARQLQQTAQSRKQNLDQVYVTARVQIRNELRAILIEIMKEKNLNLVLNSPKVPQTPNGLQVTDVVLAHSALDISDLVTERLNATLSRVSLPATAQ